MANTDSSNPNPNLQQRAPLPFLGLACAVGVSSIYLNQPLLQEMAHSFGTTPAHIGLVAVATQVGYAAGMLCFVPLGDLLERRTLITRLFAAVSGALLLAALAPNLWSLVAASVLIGLFAAVTHIVLPIAPDLVSDDQRGRAIGIVMTGLLMGVLLARTFSGWVSHIHGWRFVFVAAAIINLAFVPLLRRRMPVLPPKSDLRYADAIRSLWTLVRTEPMLREAALLGSLIFAAFSCFWTTLAFLLESHYHLGAGVAGSFGIIGAAGTTVASVAGRLSDRHGSRFVAGLGVSILVGSFAIVWLAVALRVPLWAHLALLVLGVVVVDVGAQMAQIANQTRIFGLVPGARSRLNTVYMCMYFSGAALGSWLSSIAWARFGWNGVSALALTFLAFAALRHITGIKDSPPQRQQADACLEA